MIRTHFYQRKHLDANIIAKAMKDMYIILKDDEQQNATASSTYFYTYLHRYTN